MMRLLIQRLGWPQEYPHHRCLIPPARGSCAKPKRASPRRNPNGRAQSPEARPPNSFSRILPVSPKSPRPAAFSSTSSLLPHRLPTAGRPASLPRASSYRRSPCLLPAPSGLPSPDRRPSCRPETAPRVHDLLLHLPTTARKSKAW